MPVKVVLFESAIEEMSMAGRRSEREKAEKERPTQSQFPRSTSPHLPSSFPHLLLPSHSHY